MKNGTNLAQMTLKMYWDGKVPVNISSIVKACNIKLARFNPINEVRGKLEISNNSTTIYYNNDNPSHMNRFIVAHLLGKYLMGNMQNQIVTAQHFSRNNTNVSDIEANNFALNILMPKKTLVSAIENGYISPSDINDAALQYGVAPLAMQEALSRLQPQDFSQFTNKKVSGVEEDMMEIASAIITAKFGM